MINVNYLKNIKKIKLSCINSAFINSVLRILSLIYDISGE